jgi:hypothetical protein
MEAAVALDTGPAAGGAPWPAARSPRATSVLTIGDVAAGMPGQVGGGELRALAERPAAAQSPS